MDSPTSLFDSYEQDYHQILQSIQAKLDGDESNGDELKATLRRAEMELDEADEMVSQMEIELPSIPSSSRAAYTSRLRTARGDLARLKKLHKEQRTRAELVARPTSHAPSDDPYGESNSSDRTRLLAGTSLLEDGSRRLQESQRIALETEALGGDILMNLHEQGETIQRSRDTLQQADSSIDRASGTLKKMIRRMYQQRVVTVAIIGILILLIVIVVWSKVVG